MNSERLWYSNSWNPRPRRPNPALKLLVLTLAAYGAVSLALHLFWIIL